MRISFNCSIATQQQQQRKRKIQQKLIRARISGNVSNRLRFSICFVFFFFWCMLQCASYSLNIRKLLKLGHKSNRAVVNQHGTVPNMIHWQTRKQKQKQKKKIQNEHKHTYKPARRAQQTQIADGFFQQFSTKQIKKKNRRSAHYKQRV